ncbi:S8 family serine peptidase [Kribbella sp. NPDC051587]|uniref:S8 family serine peptidase n=1 Tax=Kribbella sp. NPDC051587 TaxID=3364119 RepID=UPI0037BAF518
MGRDRGQGVRRELQYRWHRHSGDRPGRRSRQPADGRDRHPLVVAAGNEGPRAGTVDSPGSADAALTVGAVDKQDQLADFSSVGPRVGDGAVKPDVTAPGVDIVAARSKAATIGTPVGDKYLQLSGTSMATPHTAGAVAILAQEHPEWKAPELKAAITGSAKPAAGRSTFQQGAGRIDVAKGIKQTVVSDPGNLSFGTAVWPHNDDEPITKPLTYRNLGDQPVTLNLAATLTDPAGNAAPAGALQLSSSTVTVPAGGTASVQAISNTKHSGPDGAYSGRVVATAGDASVVTGIGLTKEVESYALKLTATGPDGQPTAPYGMYLGLDGNTFEFFGNDENEVTLRLPKGAYHLQGELYLNDPNAPDNYLTYLLVQPKLQLTKDTSVNFDTRIAQPVKVTVPKPEAKVAIGLIGYLRSLPGQDEPFNYSALAFSFDGVFSAQLGPAVPPDELTGYVESQWGEPGPDEHFTNSPYLYAQANSFPGFIPTGFTRDVQPRDLAEINFRINAASDRPLDRAVFSSVADSAIGLQYDQPAAIKVLVDARTARWSSMSREFLPNPDPNNPFPEIFTTLLSPDRQYRAGQKYQERSNAAVFTPGPKAAVRTGNELTLRVDSLRDADGNRGATKTDSESSKLLRDGKVIAETPFFGEISVADLPTGKSTYTLQTSMTRPSVAAFTTRTDLSWTFSSAATTTETPLPMVGVAYQPKVDKFNVVDRTPVTVLPFSLVAQPNSAVPAVKKVELQVSGDDGKTWHPAPVVGHRAVFATPKGAKTISLKAHVVDAQGNITDQTTIGAYPLR